MVQRRSTYTTDQQRPSRRSTKTQGQHASHAQLHTTNATSVPSRDFERPATRTRRAQANSVQRRHSTRQRDARLSYQNNNSYYLAADYPPAPRRPRKKRIFPLVLLLIAILAATVGIYSWATRGYVSPYTWSNIRWDSNGRPSYYVNNQKASMLGIDVSSHDLDIDWSQVAADGIEFAYVRLGYRGYTEGGLSIDETFATNITGAKNAGLKVGVYFFSQAKTKAEAKEEAQLVLATLDETLGTGASLTYLDLPIAFDHETIGTGEGRADNLDSDTVTGIANAFCTRIEDAGYQTIIYSNIKDRARLQDSLFENKARPAWLAQYSTSTPSAMFDFCIWQYSETGKVAGISTDVDMDIWFTYELPFESYANAPN